MAVNSARSMNEDLHSGVNDGRLKNLTPDRGGVLENDPKVVIRAGQLQAQYNVTDIMKGITPKVLDHEYESGYAED
jgi:hypothetical protein